MLAEDLGVQFIYKSMVDEIVLKNEVVQGVKVKGALEKSSIVVSNMDVWYTYKKLLPHQKAPEHSLNQERSSSAFFCLKIKNKTNLDTKPIYRNIAM